MHRILRTFYERWKYRHVDEAAFRGGGGGGPQRDLTTSLPSGCTGTELYDYAVGGSEPAARARVLTRVEVVRKAPGRFPQDVAVIAQGDTALARTDGLAEREWVELRTRTGPAR